MDNRTHAKVHAEILKRLEDLEKENERLRLLVESVRATLVRFGFKTQSAGKEVSVWHYFLGGMCVCKITEVFNNSHGTNHTMFGKWRYPEHGYTVTPGEHGAPVHFHHPMSGEIVQAATFFSLSDAETFVRGFFNGNPDMCVIVDGKPDEAIKDN
jgi:hypothetical protein